MERLSIAQGIAGRPRPGRLSQSSSWPGTTVFRWPRIARSA